MIEFKDAIIARSGKLTVTDFSRVFDNGIHVLEYDQKAIFEFLNFKESFLKGGLVSINHQKILPKSDDKSCVLLFQIDGETFSLNVCVVCEKKKVKETRQWFKNIIKGAKKEGNDKLFSLLNSIKSDDIGFILLNKNNTKNLINWEEINAKLERAKDFYTFLILETSPEKIIEAARIKEEAMKDVSVSLVNEGSKIENHDGTPLQNRTFSDSEYWKILGLETFNTSLLVLLLLSVPFLFLQNDILFGVLFLIMSVVLIVVEFPILYSFFDFIDWNKSSIDSKIYSYVSITSLASVVLGSLFGLLFFVLLGTFNILINFEILELWFFIFAIAFFIIAILFIVFIRPIRKFVNSIKKKK